MKYQIWSGKLLFYLFTLFLFFKRTFSLLFPQFKYTVNIKIMVGAGEFGTVSPKVVLVGKECYRSPVHTFPYTVKFLTTVKCYIKYLNIAYLMQILGSYSNNVT